jgi:hypothetical protein
MPIYRLEPIEDFLREQSWRHSVLKTTCWVRALNEDHARLRIAKAAAATPANPADILESPWLSPVLTMCIEENPSFHMEPEITVRVDGVAQAWAAPPER